MTAAKLGDAQVTTAKLASGAVGSVALADASVTTAKLGDAAATTAKLADSAVTTAKLAPDAVTSLELFDGAVTTSKLADGGVTGAKLGLTLKRYTVTGPAVVTDCALCSASKPPVTATDVGTVCMLTGVVPAWWVANGSSGGALEATYGWDFPAGTLPVFCRAAPGAPGSRTWVLEAYPVGARCEFICF